MKIKKKDLRRGEAQLPINYPAPELSDDFAFSLDVEKSRVENLCKRLAHNEASVREAVLVELPRYLREATQRLAQVEQHADADGLRHFVTMQQKKHALRRRPHTRRSNRQEEEEEEREEEEEEEVQGKLRTRVDAKKKTKKIGKTKTGALQSATGEVEAVTMNVLRELDAFRVRSTNARREQLRQIALDRIRQNQSDPNGTDMADVTNEGTMDEAALTNANASTPPTSGSLRQMYRCWINVWAETELLLLKLSRGLFFCLWHTDKPLAQLDCAGRMARLLQAPHTWSGKVLLFSCLMRVLGREWRTMDRYRADKFLALVRKLMYELFCLIQSTETESAPNAEDHTPTPSKGANKTPKRNAKGLKKTTATKGTETDAKHKNKNNNHTTGLLLRVLEEACYVFQEQIFPEASAVGLSMHVCDVFFDELTRAAVSPWLFVELSDRVPLFAMSRGNFVEKRVLDFFIAPLASGSLTGRRGANCATPETIAMGTKRGAPDSPSDARIAEEKEEEETRGILIALAERCKRYAVARRTVPAVRVMFAEAEMALRQAADPNALEELSRRAMRHRIEREVVDADATRYAVVEERKNVRLLSQQERRTKRRRVEKDGAHGEAAEMGITRVKKVKSLPRNTKRKKHYTLTKKDLFDDEE